MKSYGLVGHPIAHSKSPFIFKSAFDFLKMDATYQLFDAQNLDDFVKNAKYTD